MLRMLGTGNTLLFLLGLACGLTPGLVEAQMADEHSSHASGAMDHSAHMQSMNTAARYRVSRETYNLPDVNLLDQNGRLAPHLAPIFRPVRLEKR